MGSHNYVVESGSSTQRRRELNPSSVSRAPSLVPSEAGQVSGLLGRGTVLTLGGILANNNNPIRARSRQRQGLLAR